MGKYEKTILQMTYDKLKKMGALGESRHQGKRQNNINKIYSTNTFKNYKKHATNFAKWTMHNYPNDTGWKYAKRHIKEYMEQLEAKGLSPNSLATINAALNKVYEVPPKERYKAPARHRSEIKNNRGTPKRATHFSEANNDTLIRFCKATGGRRSALEKLIKDDLMSRETLLNRHKQLLEMTRTDSQNRELRAITDALESFQEETIFIKWERDKNGKTRYSPIAGSEADKQLVVAKFRQAEAGERIWGKISGNAPIHRYRAIYAGRIYRKFKRDLDSLPRNEKYICRADMAGKQYDRVALKKTSKALGHNRVEVVARSYSQQLDGVD